MSMWCQDKKSSQEVWWYQLFNAVVMPRCQAMIMLAVFSLAALMAYWPITDFHSTERSVPLTSVTPNKVAEWGVMPTPVSIGLEIINFATLDFVNNVFVIEGVIWFSFDPALISLDTVGKFSFEKGEILQKSEPVTQVAGNKLFARYDIRVRFTTDLEYSMFPFDDHTIYITIVNRWVAPSEMIFDAYATNFNIAAQIATSGWDIYSYNVHTGYSESVFDKYEQGRTQSNPKAVFSIDFRRVGVRNILLILLPLFLIYFLSLFALSFDPKKNSGTVLSISTAGVTSLLSYRFVIEAMTPKNVGYFVLSDRIFILLLALALMEFIFAIIMVSSSVFTRTLVILRGTLFLIMNSIILLAWYYFLFKSV